MKNDYEMYQSVLSKRNEHREKKERQKRIIIRTIPVFACFVLTAGLGLGYWNYSKNIPNIPSYPDINEEVTTTSSELTTSLSTHINSAATISSTKTVRTTTAHTTENAATSAAETSTSTESTETTVADTTETAAVTETEPPTQNTTATVTMTTQSSVRTTVTTQDVAHITTSVTTMSGNDDTSIESVTINGITYYKMTNIDDAMYYMDIFLGYGTDFIGVYQNDPSVEYYTILGSDNMIAAKLKNGTQVLFQK